MNKIEESVVKWIANLNSIDANDISESKYMDLFSSSLLDSLSFLQLIIYLQDEFNANIELNLIPDNVISINNLIKAIKSD